MWSLPIRVERVLLCRTTKSASNGLVPTSQRRVTVGCRDERLDLQRSQAGSTPTKKREKMGPGAGVIDQDLTKILYPSQTNSQEGQELAKNQNRLMIWERGRMNQAREFQLLKTWVVSSFSLSLFLCLCWLGIVSSYAQVDWRGIALPVASWLVVAVEKGGWCDFCLSIYMDNRRIPLEHRRKISSRVQCTVLKSGAHQDEGNTVIGVIQT